MMVVVLKDKFGNFPILKTNLSLVENQPFTVSFVDAEDHIIVDMDEWIYLLS